MNCRFCGEEVSENSLKCPNCGMEHNETPDSKEDVFICPVCNMENPPGERKCKYCCSLF